MSRLGDAFKDKSGAALIAYVTVGYPSLEATLEVVPALAASGCDIIEMGIPFSDPLADGATIQKASFQALENGVTPEKCLEVAAKLRAKIGVPLVFMTYFNPVYRYGVERFCLECSRAKVDGLIVPDLPPDEGSELEQATAKHNMDLIYLLAPNSSEDRIKLVAEKSRGFIYLVSVTGVTGARTSLPSDLRLFIGKVRKYARQPLCVGFGISTPEQAVEVGAIADGVIIGSRILQLMESGIPAVSEFTRQVKTALQRG